MASSHNMHEYSIHELDTNANISIQNIFIYLHVLFFILLLLDTILLPKYGHHFTSFVLLGLKKGESENLANVKRYGTTVTSEFSVPLPFPFILLLLFLFLSLSLSLCLSLSSFTIIMKFDEDFSLKSAFLR